MPKVRCPYCHGSIPESQFAAHEARHREARPDGQRSESDFTAEGTRGRGEGGSE